jgi:hypothetical protein
MKITNYNRLLIKRKPRPNEIIHPKRLKDYEKTVKLENTETKPDIIYSNVIDRNK